MMRNLRILGLALSVVAVLGAFAAPASHGDEFTAESYPATITGGGSIVTLTTTGTVSCKKKSVFGIIKSAAHKISTILNVVSECTAFGFPATVDINGCEYEFTLQSGTSTSGDVDLLCPAGQEITVTAISAGTTKCTVHIASQSDIGGSMTAANSGAGTTRVASLASALSGIDYTHTKGTGLGACTAGSSTTGTSESSTELTGETEAGVHIGIFLS
jgi:hypothetical protein